MDFKAATTRIDKDFCTTFQAKYLKGQWGIVAGYKTVPLSIVIMRKRLADWQNLNDCTKSLCIKSKLKTRCPEEYILINGICCYKGCLPSTYPNPSIPDSLRPYSGTGCLPCNDGTSESSRKPCPDNPDPISETRIITLPALAKGGHCVLNPPLSAKGKCGWHRRFMNIDLVLINSFIR